MSEFAIRAEQIGKRYRLRGGRRGDHFWALRGVSFDIARGEAVGIVGRNGAGKSVLLRVLARITGPTEGRAVIRGRVGALFQVGAGFHPDLSGRENVYFSGALLGMTRREIAHRFDEIIAFAGVEQFVDAPLLHYSSGMAVRLAVAVALHLEADIVFFDEIWAAADSEFQERALQGLTKLVGGGCTALIVSHAPADLERLCARSILLDHGRLVLDASTREVLARHKETVETRAANRPGESVS